MTELYQKSYLGLTVARDKIRFMKARRIKINKKLLIPALFLLITSISLFIRFWNYKELLNFYGDPPYYLHEVKEMVDLKKPKLIGPMVISKMIMGRGFFTGPTFYYLLAILGITLNWNVVAMTGYFTLLFLVTFALIFFWLKRHYSESIALMIYALLSFLPLFIPYSRLMWNPHLLPIFCLLFLWFLEERRGKLRNYFLAGLFFGLGLSVHYSALFWLAIILFYFVTELTQKPFSLKNWILFGLGAIIAESPFLLFELRHNFYNLRTFLFQIKYFELSPGYTFKLSYYYYFSLLPLFCKLYAAGLKKITKIVSRKAVVFTQLVLISALLLISLGPERQKVFYPRGWSLKTQQKVIDLIVNDDEKAFEVATTINSDTRALDLRWWLRQRNLKPMAVEDYDKTNILYLVAPESRPPETETVWEVKTLKPFTIVLTEDLGEGLIFYKLVRSKLRT